jgi:ParB family chromosome partitioning protein
MKGKVAAPVSVGNLVMLPVDDIGPHPKNPRDDFDVDPLAESLAEYRLLSPILARPLPEGSATAFQIVAGHRRWMAAKKNGWPFIFALLCELNDQQALELLAAENQHRKNLNDIELAQLVKTLHDPIEQGGAGWTDEKIASYFRKKTPSWANNMRRVLQLPNEILDHVRKGLLPISSARLLIPYQRDQPTAFAPHCGRHSSAPCTLG